MGKSGLRLPIRLALLTMTLAVLPGIGWQAPADASPRATGNGCGKPLTAGTTNNTLTVRGVVRSYIVVVPAGVDPSAKLPVCSASTGAVTPAPMPRTTWD